jgi:hypothetical protein
MKTVVLEEDKVILSPEEKETIIRFDQTQEKASVFTYRSSWIKHLENKLGLKPIFDNSQGGKEYLVDKKLISKPRAPRAKRILTEEQRQIKSLRMKNVQEKRRAARQ